MLLLIKFFVWLVRTAGAGCLIFVPSFALAGAISFSASFAGEEIVLTNTGSDAGYRLSLWSLGASAKWQAVDVLAGNTDYLPPTQSIKVRRKMPSSTSGLGRSDPLLVLLFDMAGSRITQLAWRQAPVSASYTLPTQRHGRQLAIAPGNAQALKIVATHAIAVPYEGIARLAHGFPEALTPPDPMRHLWADGPSMTMDTGDGQAGVWLLHETAAGDLQMQIVADGRVRGQEQLPAWLKWARRDLMRRAQLLAALGALLLLATCVWSARRHRAGVAGAAPI